MPASKLQRLIESQHLPLDWTLGVIDSNGLVAARKPNGNRWIGTPISARLAQQLAEGNEKPFQSMSLDGIETVAVANKSKLTSWAYVVAVPQVSYGSVMSRSASQIYGGGAFILLSSIVAASWMASRVHRPVTALWRQAQRLEAGKTIRFRRTGGKECDVVSQALASASQRIEESRSNLEARISAALQEAACARIDGLTGLANRRHFDELLIKEDQLSRRHRSPLTLAMIDVDNFKAYNDHYGHPGGDECLKAISQALSRVSRRPGDILARYGGEEMVFLLPNTDSCGAAVVAEAARAAVEALLMPHAACDRGSVSVSIGYATAISDGTGSA
ncbi:MAG: GGDEF domain-containing protein, partial [Cytophagaceae bacterium]